MPERARTDLCDIMPPLSQSLDPIEPRHTERWEQESLRYNLVPCQPDIDEFLGLLSNPGGFHQDRGTESDYEQEVHRAVVG
jgi:hypothetical protein